MYWMERLRFFLALFALGSGFHVSKQHLKPFVRNGGDFQVTNVEQDIDTLEATKEYINRIKDQVVKIQDYLGTAHDIEVEYLSDGFTNFCFRCYSQSDPTKSVFIKHAKENTKQLSNFKLSSNRLTTEYIASRTFSKYTPSVLPKLLHYDDKSKYLITEFLTDFKTLKEYMIEGVIDVDCCRFMGTVMGRSHARTHEAILNASSIARFRQEFGNLDHFQVWKTNMFNPTITTLTATKYSFQLSKESQSVVPESELESEAVSEADYVNRMLVSFNDATKRLDKTRTEPLSDRLLNLTESHLTDVNKDGDISRAVNELQSIYLDKKECLIHGDLHSGNIMMADPGKLDYESMNIDHQSPFRVVDFEKACFGPAGLDLGMFLANYLWYYIASPNPSVRRSIVSAVLTVLEAYKSAFRLQISNALAHSSTTGSASSSDKPSITRTVDDLLHDVFVDALGFLGLYPLFLCVALPNLPMLPLDGVDGLNWGDSDGRLLSVRRRHIQSSADALTKFLDLHSSRNVPTGGSESVKLTGSERLAVSSKAILNVFSADEDRFLIDHPTEFWY